MSDISTMYSGPFRFIYWWSSSIARNVRCRLRRTFLFFRSQLAEHQRQFLMAFDRVHDYVWRQFGSAVLKLMLCGDSRNANAKMREENKGSAW